MSAPTTTSERFLQRHGLRCALICASIFSSTLDSSADDDISFNRDIRPILAENCFQCHGPDARARKAKLRLDTRAGATADRNGLAAVVPSDADGSLLIQRITSGEEASRMPPAETGKALTPQQQELLRRWIAAGAQFERHW
ncbi:MAG: hypothetical protein O7F08_06355, partial [Deltaproteobacteria bacterium]|nr:hypothetical protein [Deltaproteobacteria bacterium]